MEQQHNFARTVCACDNCKACCKRQPGPLAPGDMERIASWLAERQGTTYEIALCQVKRQLWASPGALVRDLITGQTRRIGSITPRYRKGRCVFLDDEERCTIHPVAPFGCAFFDTHMDQVTAQERSSWLATAQQDPEYQKQRDALPYATHHKPQRYT
jgi:Fe-S-cluster containining protein